MWWFAIRDETCNTRTRVKLRLPSCSSPSNWPSTTQHCRLPPRTNHPHPPLRLHSRMGGRSGGGDPLWLFPSSFMCTRPMADFPTLVLCSPARAPVAEFLLCVSSASHTDPTASRVCFVYPPHVLFVNSSGTYSALHSKD